MTGGEHNTAAQDDSVVDGGYGNETHATWSSITGGLWNGIGGTSEFYKEVCPYEGTKEGEEGCIYGPTGTGSGQFGSITGGEVNSATGTLASVAGGVRNRAFGEWSFIGGGYGNIVKSGTSEGAILGGESNTIESGDYDTILGGRDHFTTGTWTEEY